MSVAAGVIAIWTGTIVNIPAGWDLCDGNGGRPNLLSKFLISVAVATDPGGGGGSDTHTHVEDGTGGAHDHGGTSGAGGVHQHTTPTTTGSHRHGSGRNYRTTPNDTVPQYAYAGNHNHTWVSEGSHTHSIDSKSHAHTVQNGDTRPAYYEVAFIYSDGSPTNFPTGVTALWSDVLGNIPAGFALVAGLVAKFLVSVDDQTDPGTTGGSDTPTHTQDSGGDHTHALGANAVHSHTSVTTGAHVHPSTTGDKNGNNTTGLSSAGDHSHTSEDAAGHTHTAQLPGGHIHTIDNTADGRPPYYELAPIAAGGGGASLAIGLICIWTGTIANIPASWELCDGNGSGPNLLEKFIRGVATGATNPGDTGGFTTHTHTVQAAGAHTHTQDSQGVHIHTAINGDWSHLHGMTKMSASAPVALNYMQYTSGGDSHNHGDLSSLGAHVDHTTTDPGTHVDHTMGAGSSLPAYYEVAFIYLESIPTENENPLIDRPLADYVMVGRPKIR